MTSEYIDIFVRSAKEVINQIIGLETKVCDIFIKTTPFKSNNLVILIGLNGKLNGSTILAFDNESAIKIASIMMGGFPISTLDEIAKSAIAELSNMILGHACTEFSKNNINVDITPPTILSGEDLQSNVKNQNITCIPFVINDDYHLEMNAVLE